jgi:hypothetical protein
MSINTPKVGRPANLVGEYKMVDRIINTTFYKPMQSDPTKKDDVYPQLTIICPEHGVKPSVELTLTMVPGGVTTEIKLAFMNFMPETDLAEWNMMEIEAGYAGYGRNPPITQFFSSIAIFSSYIEKPNPNGRTVFTGIVGGWIQNNLRKSSRQLFFFNKTIKFGDLLYGIIEGKGLKNKNGETDTRNLGLGLKVKHDLPQEVLDTLIELGPNGEYWAESGFAVLTWLQDNIVILGNYLVKEYDDPDMRLMTYLDGDVFYVFMKGKVAEDKMDKTGDTYVNLDKVTSATFQGAALDIVAPWNPLLTPGGLFHMGSKYFRGRMSPNVIMKKTDAMGEGVIDENDLYRVITMDLNFSTTGTNSMKILAVKASAWVHTQAEAKELTVQEAREIVFTDSDTETRDMIFGDEPTAEVVEDVPEEVVQDVDKLWGMFKGFTDEFEGEEYVVKKNDSLTALAHARYKFEYTKTREQGNGMRDIDGSGMRPYTYYTKTIIPGTAFFVIIAGASFDMFLKQCKAKNEDPNTAGKTVRPGMYNNYKFRPQLIYPGELIWIPRITDPDVLVDYREFFLEMARLAYDANKTGNNWKLDKTMIDYLPAIEYFLELKSLE